MRRRGTDGALLDGRNRLAACKEADVEPKFDVYSGTNKPAYILGANLVRRNVTRGQKP